MLRGTSLGYEKDHTKIPFLEQTAAEAHACGYVLARLCSQVYTCVCLSTGKTTVVKTLAVEVYREPGSFLYLIYNVQGRLAAQASGLEWACTYHALAGRCVCAAPGYIKLMQSFSVPFEEAVASLNCDRNIKVQSVLWTLFSPHLETLTTNTEFSAIEDIMPLPILAFEAMVCRLSDLALSYGVGLTSWNRPGFQSDEAVALMHSLWLDLGMDEDVQTIILNHALLSEPQSLEVLFAEVCHPFHGGRLLPAQDSQQPDAYRNHICALALLAHEISISIARLDCPSTLERLWRPCMLNGAVKVERLLGLKLAHSEYIWVMLHHRLAPVFVPKKVLVVEEYQDMTYLFFLMVQHVYTHLLRLSAQLARRGVPHTCKLIVIGNDAQAINYYIGALPNIRELITAAFSPVVYTMLQSHRLPQALITYANSFLNSHHDCFSVPGVPLMQLELGSNLYEGRIVEGPEANMTKFPPNGGPSLHTAVPDIALTTLIMGRNKRIISQVTFSSDTCVCASSLCAACEFQCSFSYQKWVCMCAHLGVIQCLLFSKQQRDQLYHLL